MDGSTCHSKWGKGNAAANWIARHNVEEHVAELIAHAEDKGLGYN